MSRLKFDITELEEDISVYGLSKKSNDKTQSKDIPAISQKYYKMADSRSGEVLPFFVISRDYDVNTKDFTLLIGGLHASEKLELFTIPKGIYVKTTIKPKLGFLWGLSIGEAKRAFYMNWLPDSDYESLNMEYEYHTKISKGKNPQIDILFSVKDAQNK